jgi:hypothetical protein
MKAEPVYDFPEFIPLKGMARVRKFFRELRYVWSIKACRKHPIGMLRHAYYMSRSEMKTGTPIDWRITKE